jgi:uncharacterized damage-inducible protein DinB
MKETALIADELRRAFYGEAWHGDSLFEILRGVTAAQAAARPINTAHSIWELVLHISAWDGAARRRMTGVAVALTGAANFPPVAETSEAAWKQALEKVRRVHDELIEAVSNFPATRLAEQVPGKKGAHYNFSYMLHGLAQHAAYHAGQIALLKKMR